MTKRPDQHNIDPSEAGSTDYKDFPQTGRGTAGNLDDVDIDKRNLTTGGEQDESGPAPGQRPEPSESVRDAERRQAEAGVDEEEDEGRGRDDG